MTKVAFNYTEPSYGGSISFTMRDFKSLCRLKVWTDSDGYGHPVKDKLMDSTFKVYPSMMGHIQTDATHVVWFNG